MDNAYRALEGGRGYCISYTALYGEALHKRGTFSMLQI